MRSLVYFLINLIKYILLSYHYYFAAEVGSLPCISYQSPGSQMFTSTLFS